MRFSRRDRSEREKHARRETDIVGIGVLLAVCVLFGGLLFVGTMSMDPVAAQQGDQIGIDQINGDSPDQIHNVTYHADAGFNVTLSGIDPEEWFLTVDIGDHRARTTVSGKTVVIEPEAHELEGDQVHTLTVTAKGNRTTLTAETEIRITDAGDIDSTADNITVDSVDGEDPGRINNVTYHADSGFNVTLSGVDPGEWFLTVDIGDHRARTTVTSQTVVVEPKSHELAANQVYTLNVTAKGDRTTLTDETEIRITDAGSSPPEATNVSIESVEGESPAGINNITYHAGTGFNVTLSGIDPGAWFLTIDIGDHRASTSVSGKTVVVDPKSHGLAANEVYTLNLTAKANATTLTDQTEIRITDAGYSPPEATNLSIESVEGERPADINNVTLHSQAGFEVAISGIDPSQWRVLVDIGDQRARMSVSDDTIAVEPQHHDLNENQVYTLTVRAKANATTLTAETEIRITDAGYSPPEPPNFSIESVDGEDPDGINNVTIHSGSGFNVTLAGIDPDEWFLVIDIGDQRARTSVSDDTIAVEPEHHELAENEVHTLTVTATANQTTTTAETGIRIADAGPLDPTTHNITIESVNGEAPNRINNVTYHADAGFELEYDGIDPDEWYLTVNIDGERVSSRVDGRTLTIVPRVHDFDEGVYTLEVNTSTRSTAITAETQIRITQAASTSTAQTNLTIAAVDSEDPSQINNVTYHAAAGFTVTLSGIDPGEWRLTVDIGDHRANTTVSGQTLVVEPMSHGLEANQVYPLAITAERNRTSLTAETAIRITDTGLIDSTEYNITIEAVNGEDPEQVNNLTVDADSEFELEVSGIDLAEWALDVEIDGQHLSSDREGNTVTIGLDGTAVEAGVHTLELSAHTDDTNSTAETEIRITEGSQERDNDTTSTPTASPETSQEPTRSPSTATPIRATSPTLGTKPDTTRGSSSITASRETSPTSGTQPGTRKTETPATPGFTHIGTVLTLVGYLLFRRQKRKLA